MTGARIPERPDKVRPGSRLRTFGAPAGRTVRANMLKGSIGNGGKENDRYQGLAHAGARAH